jgi:hypothetical protein
LHHMDINTSFRSRLLIDWRVVLRLDLFYLAKKERDSLANSLFVFRALSPTDFCMGAAIFDHKLFGALTPPHRSWALGFPCYSSPLLSKHSVPCVSDTQICASSTSCSDFTTLDQTRL